jgi:hypothetical protein
MEITASSNLNRSLFCQIRKEFVKETAEERVRQRTLSSLCVLGFPLSLIIVERRLSELPHLQLVPQRLPNRRVDIICYQAKTMRPLLLIECKQSANAAKDKRQLFGYNAHIGAAFVSLVSQDQIFLFEAGTGRQIEGFLSYSELISLPFS